MTTVSVDSKFFPLYDYQTAAPNYDLQTEDIVAKLQAWDKAYGIEIADVADDAVTVMFETLPPELDELAGLATDIYDFCPDVIDQHFGCFDDLVELHGTEPVPTEFAELIAGIDFSDENFGMALLMKSLQINKSVALWWD